MDQLGRSGQVRKDHARWKGEALGDASNARIVVQDDLEKSLVVRRVGWTDRGRLGTIGGLAGFDRLGHAPYR
jgi:hypothetical protein